MSWFSSPAPVEQSHAERAVNDPGDGPHPCSACGDTARVHRHQIGGGFGWQWVCVKPGPCLDRAGYLGRRR